MLEERRVARFIFAACELRAGDMLMESPGSVKVELGDGGSGERTAPGPAGARSRSLLRSSANGESAKAVLVPGRG